MLVNGIDTGHGSLSIAEGEINDSERVMVQFDYPCRYDKPVDISQIEIESVIRLEAVYGGWVWTPYDLDDNSPMMELLDICKDHIETEGKNKY